MDAITQGAQDFSDFDYNVFLVDRPSPPYAELSWPEDSVAFVFVDRHTDVQTVENTIAHELGHLLNLDHPEDVGESDPENLMNIEVENPEKLRKNQWETLHPVPGP